MECKHAFSDFISNCQTGIIVNAHITPITNYQWLIVDKFDNEYVGTLTTDANGNFTIPVTDLPPGLLNSYSGWFALQVLELYTAKPVELKMSQFYDAIQFQVKGGTREKDNLGII